MNNYIVYLLECNDGTFYVGITNNIEKRLQTHNSGKGAKYTKPRLPVKLLVKTKIIYSRSEVSKLEYIIKQLPKKEKIKYIKEINNNDK